MICELSLETESDVEQKLIYPLLTTPSPEGLGFTQDQIMTKANAKKIQIGKGKESKLYYPDYVIFSEGLPTIIIEAKKPGTEQLVEAYREARLYATEINSSYPKNINPCRYILATNGSLIWIGFSDTDRPEVEVSTTEMSSNGEGLTKILQILNKEQLAFEASNTRKLFNNKAKFYKPIFMLGGETTISSTVGENAFGSNLSLEYKTLFNPESFKEKEEVVKNAYVSSKRRDSHVTPIDRMIRSAIPGPHRNTIKLATESPKEVFDVLCRKTNYRNEICLLIGSVGSGKSTFATYLETVALPSEIAASTHWLHVNLNNAPLSKDKIYAWIIEELLDEIRLQTPEVDFDSLLTLKEIYQQELAALEKGRASLYPKDSDRFLDIMYDELKSLQNNREKSLANIISYAITSKGKLPVIVLDNCDKRNRDDQLLMFEVAAWIKSKFPVMIFLPLRDTTYDQYCNLPPLDTVIKDLAFRIDPPLLEKVIQKRLKYLLRGLNAETKFEYHLDNGMRVDCSEREVGRYLQCIVHSLFQTKTFPSIIKGIAGRNIRKGLEVILDFCKSGYISTDEIMKMRTSSGTYMLPNHIIYKVLFKGNRKYYGDGKSKIINLFAAEQSDDIPDPFVRIDILQWLKRNMSIKGPSNTNGLHKACTLIKEMQYLGHSQERVLTEIKQLIDYECITSESLTQISSEEDLICITASGSSHLLMLTNPNYLAAVAEDTLFRDQKMAKHIAGNITGKGDFAPDSHCTVIDTSLSLLLYLSNYRMNFMPRDTVSIERKASNDDFSLETTIDSLESKRKSDPEYLKVFKAKNDYPIGSQHKGVVVNIIEYGAFVGFEDDITGYLPFSKISSTKPKTDLAVGKEVSVEIVSFSPEHKRLQLKLSSRDN